MFQTTSYDVTTDLRRKPSKASTLLRDIKRKSLRKRKRIDPVELNNGKILILFQYFMKLITFILGTFGNLNPNQIVMHDNLEASKRRHINNELNDELFNSFNDDDQENKENTDPKPTQQTFSRSVKKRCSGIFRGKAAPSLPPRPPLQPLHVTNDQNMVEVATQNPVKQGYMYKKSKTTGVYHRKYVTLGSDRVVSYYPTFLAFSNKTGARNIPVRGVLGRDQNMRHNNIKDNELLLISEDNSHFLFQLCSGVEARQWKVAIENILCSHPVLTFH